MKLIHSLFLLAGFSLIAACQSSQANTMVLLDANIKEVNISPSMGTGDINQEVIFSFRDAQSVEVWETAITTAVKQSSEVINTSPDYDIVVEYEEGYPAHAMHLWLGQENKKSTLMYLVEEDGPYLTSALLTNQLRELLEQAE
ncbi:hypothetical protein [Alkalicoccus daliensis]|uniref:YhfM-like domain-containing protein n=1 Tax=Alkalicoccus daliensis TaxID=745820 RepID=A0A1H0ERD8_9BACI|nr:hypothetical protein [Alkalicoccus daliensis]SDN84948.1 hypothetical protein SAMN04488053_10432 [Alkalicoccus daliensis]